MPPPPSLSDAEVRERIDAVPHWYHQIEVRPGIVTPGINDSQATLDQLELPADCTGLRVLDIGARDGFFSFELERRGAAVLAIDYIDPQDTGFAIARELLGSRVEFVVENLYDLEPDRHGTFDIVLFLGVLYHLRDPLLALDRIWGVCREDATLALETQMLEDALLLPDGSFRALREFDPVLDDVPLAQFYPGDALRGDHTNYWAPNAACMRGLMNEAGFAVTHEVVSGARGIFQGRRGTSAATQYYKRLEKGTLRDASEQAARPAGDAAEAARLQSALASAQYRQRATDDELDGARRYIVSLEETLARKDRELEEAIAYNERVSRTPPPPGPAPGVLQRAAAALERRRR